MNVWLALPLAAPLIGAALSIIVRRLMVQRAISFVALATSLVAATLVGARGAI